MGSQGRREGTIGFTRRHPARRKTTEKKQRNIEVQVEIHNKIEIQEQTQGGDTRRNRPQEEVPLAREEPAAREHEPGRELHDNKGGLVRRRSRARIGEVRNREKQYGR
ncbi:hypothetical protein MTO96_040175 [Rhipicephalus appendiculatus]